MKNDAKCSKCSMCFTWLPQQIVAPIHPFVEWMHDNWAIDQSCMLDWGLAWSTPLPLDTGLRTNAAYQPSVQRNTDVEWWNVEIRPLCLWTFALGSDKRWSGQVTQRQPRSICDIGDVFELIHVVEGKIWTSHHQAHLQTTTQTSDMTSKMNWCVF